MRRVAKKLDRVANLLIGYAAVWSFVSIALLLVMNREIRVAECCYKILIAGGVAAIPLTLLMILFILRRSAWQQAQDPFAMMAVYVMPAR